MSQAEKLKAGISKASQNNESLAKENERMAKALADAEESHEKELAASRDAAEKEKQEYLERFLQSEAFCHSAMYACNGLFKKAIFMLYRDFAKAYPVLPEEVGVRDYSDQEMEIPSGYLATCRWDEKKDRLVDPEGELVETQLNRKAALRQVSIPPSLLTGGLWTSRGLLPVVQLGLRHLKLLLPRVQGTYPIYL